MSVIMRNEKRKKKVTLESEKKRALIKEELIKSEGSYLEKIEIHSRIQKMSRNYSKTRIRSRCQITGKPRGVFKKFGLCRNIIRDLAMNGSITGLTKASW